MAITNFIPTIWSANLLENLHAAQVVVPTLNSDYEGEIVNGGEAVKITSVTQPTINTYSGSITRQALADTTQSLLIDQQKYFAYLVDDVDAVQAAGSFEPVQRDSAAALADTAENFVITDMLTNGTAGGGTAAITDFAGAYGIVSTLRKALVKANVPSTDRFLVGNPDFIALLLGAGSTLVKVNESGDGEGLRNGVVGRLSGFTVLESPATGLANANKPAAVAYHGRSVAFAQQLLKFRAQTALDAFGDQVDGLHVYGSKVLRATAVQTYVSI